MHQAEIAGVFQADGPFTSMYMDTEGDVDQAADKVAVRWKSLRGAMLAAGVPQGTVAAIDPLVGGSHRAGATLAVIAAADGPRYSANLPDPPPRDTLLRHGPLPDVLPLLAAAQATVPHVAVLTDRTGADMAARVADDVARTERVTGRVTPYIHKAHAGGWSEPRFQHRAEAIWESNASEVADALTRLVDQVRPRFVAVAGDVHALQLLHEQAPKRVRELLEVVGGEYGSLEAVFAEADKLVAATVQADNRALLDRFAEEPASGTGRPTAPPPPWPPSAAARSRRCCSPACSSTTSGPPGSGRRRPTSPLTATPWPASASPTRWRPGWSTWPSGPPSGPAPACACSNPPPVPARPPARVSAPYCASRSGRRPSPGRGVGAGPRRAAAAGSA